MSVRRPNAPWVVTRSVSVKIPDSVTWSNVGSVTAPTVDGYTFVAWIGCVSNGQVVSTYVEHAQDATTNIFAVDWQALKGYSVICTAIYQRSSS